MGGFIPFSGQTFYGAAKAAVKIFTEGLYSELKNTNVHVTIIHPEAIATNITENSGLDKPRIEKNSQLQNALSATKAAEIIIAAMEKTSTDLWLVTMLPCLIFYIALVPKWRQILSLK